jgi:hypothetical protein
MKNNEHSRSAGLYLLLAALLFQGLSGVAGGIGLVIDPSGKTIGLPIEWLQGSPFGNYLVPGIILLLVLGVVPLMAIYGLWTQQRWSWPLALFVAMALITWIGVEIIVVGYQPAPPLQLIYGVLAIGILTLVLLRSVRRYSLRQRSDQK